MSAESVMTGPLFVFDTLLDSYSDALVNYLVQPGEPNLLAAQTLGRSALGNGIGLLEMATIHHEALKSVLLRVLMDEPPAAIDADPRLGRLANVRDLLRSLTPQESAAALKAAESFFIGSIRPFEISHRQTQDVSAAREQRNTRLEEQAGRIAHALYDESLQLLAAVNLALHQVPSQSPQDDLEYLSRAGSYLDRIETQLADFSFELRPYILDNVGLDAAIRTAAIYFSKTSDIDISVETAPPGPLSWSLATIMYRAVQELLQNISRHAQATRVDIRLECEGDVIRSSVRDNGIGFEPSRIFSAKGALGLGLIGIRESVRLHGGTLTIRSGLGRGTELHISAPRYYSRPGSGAAFPVMDEGDMGDGI